MKRILLLLGLLLALPAASSPAGRRVPRTVQVKLTNAPALAPLSDEQLTERLQRLLTQQRAVEAEIDRRTANFRNEESARWSRLIGSGLSPLGGGSPETLLKALAAAHLAQSGSMTAGRYFAMGDLQPYYEMVPTAKEAWYPESPAWVKLDREIKQLRLELLVRRAQGQAAEKSPAQASPAVVKFQREEAEKGSARCQFEHGRRLFTGADGVETNEAGGLVWILESAGQGHEEALRWLQARKSAPPSLAAAETNAPVAASVPADERK